METDQFVDYKCIKKSIESFLHSSHLFSSVLFYISWSSLLLQVILILTKYYHADSTKVLESSLWR